MADIVKKQSNVEIIRAKVKDEYRKCLSDPMYFMRKYIKIQHPMKGSLPFDLYKFQEDTLKSLVDNRFNIILKSRQMGISTLCAAYSLYLMTFFNDKNVLCVSFSQEVAKEIVTKVRFANNNLPSFLKVECVEDNRLSLKFKNGSQIKAVSSNSDATRSNAVSLLLMDETAFISEANLIWTSAQATLSEGGSACLLSCVTSDTYIFSDKGIKQVSDYIPNDGLSGDYAINEYSILGVDQTRKGIYFKNNGIADTLKLTTKFGELEGSKIHKLWAYKKSTEKYDWYKLEDLCIGDYVSIQYGMNIWGNNDDISNFIPSFSNKLKSPLRKDNILLNNGIISKELAYLFGIYIAEGSCYKVLSPNGNLIGGTITITTGDKEITEVFDKLELTYCTSDDLHYCISNKNLIELFEYVGFDFTKKAHQKIIPNRLMEMSKANISSMLQGIFDGDGCSSDGDVSLASTSKQLIDQVRILLNNFGILASCFKRNKDMLNGYNNPIKFNHDSYALELYSKNALKYFNLIGFFFKRKQKNKDILLNLKDSNYLCDTIPDSVKILNKLHKSTGKRVKDLEREYNILFGDITNKKLENRPKTVSRYKTHQIYNLLKFNLSVDEINLYDRVFSDTIYWSEIKTITPDKKEVFDFSLPENKNDFWCHSIVYNGFIGHQTPNGSSGFFHQMWVEAEAKKNGFNPIRLPWNLIPHRTQEWRDEQTKLMGVKEASQEFDCNFSTSGNNVITQEILDWYKKNQSKDPVEMRGHDHSYWVWDYPNYSIDYVISADCSRGDGEDFSAFQVIDVVNMEQVAEYQGMMDTKTYGNLLVAVASEYNNALLIVENNNQGNAVLQEVIDKKYPNTFYSSADLQVIDIEKEMMSRSGNSRMTPGFTTTSKTRPLLIAKLEMYFREKSITVRSKRLLNELSTFIWHNGKAESMRGQHDDLVMSLGIGLWVRDTALRLRQQNMDMNRSLLNGLLRPNPPAPIYSKTSNEGRNQWQMPTSKTSGEKEDLKWLL